MTPHKINQLTVRWSWARRAVGPTDAKRYDLDVKRAVGREVAGVVSMSELWIESPLDEHWLVAYRIVIQRARAVVSEVRVFPNESSPRQSGVWSGAWRGVGGKTAASVPLGGVTTRLLRRVRLGHDVHSLPRIVERIVREYGRVPPGLVRCGVSVTPAAGSPRTGSGRGRPALPPHTYARIAAAYAKAVARGSTRPVQELADRFEQPVARMRSRIQRARARGYLEPGVQGQAGGRLTPLAKRLLKVKKRR